ncbi:hypothetical protein M409DRAFT_26098 [Zasmidium cellare ATCC 36951]|uniref:aldehyde dehydrogenase (NAD(+)) n=1 Tax=Zasmidium cellare ATCC 36951 TaxID=1080233 RepID=A0A6A6CDH2_ZASCE|nr:uncharacterized protein M409DRAFT_26098 [Zasmidium cellare ATCC 36951]KAF2163486.1 hypothetical protein M409DRAFT_26098 [Zasmidium cellare ATCC 36951]
MPTISTISPATNKVVLETPETTPEDAAAIAVNSAQSVITKALTLVQKRKEELGRELTAQMGRPIAYSKKKIETMQKRADYLLQTIDAALEAVPGVKEDGFERWVQKEPIGPTLLIFAWNFPYLILVNALVPALLAGNTVILKPSPQTPLVATRFQEIFEEVGLPKGVIQVLVTFTGSTAGGLALRGATAKRFVPLNLELGGNDPAYVRPDADLPYVAAQLVNGAVFNAGQSCCAVERVYVHAVVEYGLTASVWTKDLEAGRGLIQGLEAGTVFINRADYPSPDLAWTG